MSREITRREFVAAVLAGVGCLGLPGAAAAMGSAAVRSRLFRDRTLGVEHILPYTSRYLARHPAEADPEVLIGLLFGREDDVEAVKRAVRSRMRTDFEQGRVVKLDGWTLSVTEVRLWCLYVAVTT